MKRNEILENLLKCYLIPRLDSLERNESSHTSDLKFSNDTVKDINCNYYI